MKKASIRCLSGILAILLLVAMAGCAPSTDDPDSSTEAGGCSRPDTVISTENNTTDSTENNTTDSTENNTTDSTENNTTDSTEGPTEGSNVLFEDDFTDLEGWNDFPADGIPAGASVGVVDGALSIAVPTTVTAATGKTHKLDNFAGVITFEVDVTVTIPDGSPAVKQCGAVIINTDGGASVCFYILSGKLGYYDVDKTTGKTINQFADYTSGTTCNLKMVANTVMDTYDIYINGELMVEGVKFRNEGDKFTRIQINGGGSDLGATTTFDNLKIYTEG